MADRTTMMAPKPTSEPSLGELFFGFMKVGLSGFGGVIAWAHRMIVDQRRWMTEQEFIETLGFCQILPGPNIGNLSIYIGARFHGWRGSVAAFSGLMLIPFGLVLAAATLYAQFRGIAAVSGALDGISAASAGLLLAMGIKMAMHIRRNAAAALFALAAFTGNWLASLAFSARPPACLPRSASARRGCAARDAQRPARRARDPFRSPVAHRGRRRQLDPSRDAASRGRHASLDDRYGVCRALCHRPRLAGPNILIVTLIGWKAAGFLRRDRRDRRDLHAGGAADLHGRPVVAAPQPRGVATGDRAGPRGHHGRPDAGQRLCRDPRRRPELDRLCRSPSRRRPWSPEPRSIRYGCSAAPRSSAPSVCCSRRRPHRRATPPNRRRWRPP